MHSWRNRMPRFAVSAACFALPPADGSVAARGAAANHATADDRAVYGSWAHLGIVALSGAHSVSTWGPRFLLPLCRCWRRGRVGFDRRGAWSQHLATAAPAGATLTCCAGQCRVQVSHPTAAHANCTNGCKATEAGAAERVPPISVVSAVTGWCCTNVRTVLSKKFGTYRRVPAARTDERVLGALTLVTGHQARRPERRDAGRRGMDLDRRQRSPIWPTHFLS